MPVSLVKTKDPSDVKKAIDLIGGIEKFVKKGDVVFIKPNLMLGLPSPTTTDPEVVREVIRLCKSAGAKKVKVGENPLQLVTAEAAFGSLDLVTFFRDAGAEIVYLDQTAYVEKEVKGLIIDKTRFPKEILDADVYISMPKLKTHMMAGITCAVKNNQGVLMDEDKIAYHRNDLSAKLVDLLKVVSPDLIVVDGIVGMEGQGPAFGDPIESEVLIAGDNAVAVDCAAARVMGFDPIEIETNRLAIAQGHGKEEKPVGEPYSSFKKKFKKAELQSIGRLPGVKINCPGACLGCQGHIRYGVDLLGKFMPEELAKVKDLEICAGPYFRPDNKMKKRILFGNCAIRDGSVSGMKVPGCPPAKWFSLFEEIANMFNLPILDFMSKSVKRFGKKGN